MSIIIVSVLRYHMDQFAVEIVIIMIEIRFGKPNAIRFVRGLEASLTGACIDEKRDLFLGSALAYGEEGKRDGSVRPGESVSVNIEILRVRNKKPEDEGLVLGFLDKISSGNLGSFAG